MRAEKERQNPAAAPSGTNRVEFWLSLARPFDSFLFHTYLETGSRAHQPCRSFSCYWHCTATQSYSLVTAVKHSPLGGAAS